MMCHKIYSTSSHLPFFLHSATAKMKNVLQYELKSVFHCFFRIVLSIRCTSYNLCSSLHHCFHVVFAKSQLYARNAVIHLGTALCHSIGQDYLIESLPNFFIRETECIYALGIIFDGEIAALI